MLKIISINDGRSFMMPASIKLRCLPGMFGDLTRTGKIVASKGKNPYALIDDLKTDTESTFTDSVTMWQAAGVYETDQFVKQGKYDKGSLLYVGKMSRLTSHRNKNQKPIGIVEELIDGILRFQYFGHFHY